MTPFTILIPVYNTPPHHLLEAVMSVKNQTYKEPYKILVLDDGSDNELTVGLIKYLEESGLTEVYSHPVNIGTSAILNIGHGLSETEWISIMGSDDVSHPDRIRQQIHYIESHPGVELVGCNMFLFNDSDMERKAFIYTGRQLKHKPYREGSKMSYWITCHGGVFYKKSLVNAVGGYNESLRRAQDVDLWRRLYQKGNLRYATLQPNLYAWRRYK
jgi:glycosyltransferase involved in cell wall biosynthesis